MSTSADRLSRLLALVPWLLVNDGISMEAAAAHFGVSIGQLEDDLNLLICCGLPGYTHAELIDIQFWDDGIIHVLDPQTIGQPLRLSGDEATAMLVALRLLAQIPGDHDRHALISAMLRLQEAAGVTAMDAVVIDPGVDERFSGAVAEAIAAGDDLHIQYGGASDQVSERTVHPLRTLSHDGRTYVEAYCRSAGALRTFRMDRLLTATPVPCEGPIDDQGESEPSVDDAPLATIAVRAPWAAEALGVAETGELPDGRLAGTIRVHDTQWVVHTVLSLGGAAEVIAPDTLRRAVADAARTALASYA